MCVLCDGYCLRSAALWGQWPFKFHMEFLIQWNSLFPFPFIPLDLMVSRWRYSSALLWYLQIPQNPVPSHSSRQVGLRSKGPDWRTGCCISWWASDASLVRLLSGSHSRLPESIISFSPTMLAGLNCVPLPPNSYVETLTLRTSKCDCIWKQGL